MFEAAVLPDLEPSEAGDASECESGSDDGSEVDCSCDLIAMLRPTAFDREVRNNNSHEAKLVAFDQLQLPKVDRMQKGYHYGSDLPVVNLPECIVHVCWDGGAEGTTISDSCASRILFAQATLPEAARKGLVDMARQPMQRFHGFAKEGKGANAIGVDIQCLLTLQDPTSGTDLPALRCRIVPGQHDDLLVAAPDLDALGWSPQVGYFSLASCGLAVPRTEQEVRINLTRELSERGVSILRSSFDVDLDPHECRLVSVDREGAIDGTLKWLSPSSTLHDSGVSMPEGITCVVDEKQKVLLKNNTDHKTVISKGRALALERAPEEDELPMVSGLEQVSTMAKEVSSPVEKVSGTPASACGPELASPVGVLRHMVGLVPTMSALVRWILLVSLLVTRVSTFEVAPGAVFVNSVQEGLELPDHLSCSSPDWKFEDFSSAEYKAEVDKILCGMRQERYQHLSEGRWEKLRRLLKKNSDVLFVEGAKPTIIDPQYAFDIKLKDGYKPVRANLPRYSPEQARKERYHVAKEEALGHLRTPAQDELSEWSTRTHVVHKKDDEMGRWICDFRPLNLATEKRGITIGDISDKVRALANTLWKSCFDCWSGFNQIGATDFARKCMTIATSLGLRQWTVMPFGVCNGPACFQATMLDIFGPMMYDAMTDVEAVLEFFMDDGALGTGILSAAALATDDKGDKYFDQHLEALSRIFGKSRSVNLKLKLTKCFFVQYEAELLGMSVSRGIIKSDPKKSLALAAWPRPSRLEDVEKFLCTFGYIRQHLSPKFSELAKPLRDLLHDLHVLRGKGKVQKGFRRSPPRPPLANDKWPDFWTEEAEEAFNKLKELAVAAVPLFVPDYQGAADGSNPMHLFVDASKFGVGAGLFQGPPLDESELDHYQRLGVPRWATKAEVVRAYNAKKKYVKGFEGDRKLDPEIVQAFEVLSDVPARKGYDLQLGSGPRKLQSQKLRPLAFHSRSLNTTQRGWNTWDRELWAVVDFISSFSSLVTGMHLVIHTDHLNNTLLNAVLQYPDKTLRMLLKIEAKVVPHWQFLAGCMNHIGDGFSRNPVDRDEVRGFAETNEGLPKTLGEAFALVWKTNDSPNAVVAEKAPSLRVMHEDCVKLCPQRVPSQHGVAASGLPCTIVHCLLLPSFIRDEAELDDMKFVGGNDDVTLKSVVTVKPQYNCPFGTCRWLEPFSKAPWNKQVCKALRNAAYDGLLSSLRLVREGNLGGLVGYGEGAMILLALLSPPLRQAACAARGVTEDERQELEACWRELVTHVVLVAPHGNPLRYYLQFWREAIPETLCVPALENKQVVVVIPQHDASRDPSCEVASWIQDCIVVETKLPGPACKLRPERLALDCLVLEPKTDKVVVPEGKTPPTFVETWGGSCVLSAAMLAHSFVCRAYEKTPIGPGAEPQDRGDLFSVVNQTNIRRDIETKHTFLQHQAPTCASWSAIQNLNGSTRTAERPEGDGTLEREELGNKEVALALWFIFLCVSFGVLFSLEHPRGSRLWNLPLVLFLMSLAGIRVIDLDGCAFGLRPPNWNVSSGDVRIQNPSKLITNLPHFEVLRKKCASAGPHKHERAIPWHDRAGPSHSSHTSVYPQAFTTAYARAAVTAWKEGFEPIKHALPYAPLEEIESNVGMHPRILFPYHVVVDGQLVDERVTQRATGSVPKAPSPAPPASVASQPSTDFWIETESTWIWRHVLPRQKFASLEDSECPPGGPASLGVLTKRRECHAVPVGGVDKSYYVNDKDYTIKDTVRHRTVKTPFIGSTIFHKKQEKKEYVADEDVSPVCPDSFEAVSFQLSSMIPELQKAQSLDPGLKDIIMYLKKQPANTYLADPLRENRKVAARAGKYVLRSKGDGVLLMRHDPELNRDLPVVPEVPYMGESKSLDAPKRMTWKHLLLGAVHNVCTAAHKQSKEMAEELRKLVAWQRPWELRGDCDKWVQRCKLCCSVHHKRKHQPPQGTIKSCKPFFRMQWDLMEVKPTGENGEQYVLTAICPATKYPFFRALTTRDSEVVAEAMLDVILDAGVVPCVHQSDNEFCNMAISELTSLLGATQLFSTALRPHAGVDRTSAQGHSCRPCHCC